MSICKRKLHVNFGFKVLMVRTMQIMVFWVVMLQSQPDILEEHVTSIFQVNE
jgi:hypothetical protein